MTPEFLKETAKEYISKYTARLNEFLENFEAEEIDFIKREAEYFEETLYDLENSEYSIDGFSHTWINNFLLADKICAEIGWDKFNYSTIKKIKFLKSKIDIPFQQTAISETLSALEKLGANKISIAEAENMNLDYLINIESFTENTQKAMMEIIEKNGLPAYKTVDTMINFQINNIKIDISNPLKKDLKDANKFWLTKLEVMKEFFSEAEKLENEHSTYKPNKVKVKKENLKTFDELFYIPEFAETCLNILRDLNPPIIDSANNYIGKAKGIFPLWINVLKSHKPQPLIKHLTDKEYKDILNAKIKGLHLTEDASEFRKNYVRLVKNKVELDIKTILSQYSQDGKLGK